MYRNRRRLVDDDVVVRLHDDVGLLVGHGRLLPNSLMDDVVVVLQEVVDVDLLPIDRDGPSHRGIMLDGLLIVVFAEGAEFLRVDLDQWLLQPALLGMCLEHVGVGLDEAESVPEVVLALLFVFWLIAFPELFHL